MPVRHESKYWRDLTLSQWIRNNLSEYLNISDLDFIISLWRSSQRIFRFTEIKEIGAPFSPTQKRLFSDLHQELINIENYKGFYLIRYEIDSNPEIERIEKEIKQLSKILYEQKKRMDKDFYIEKQRRLIQIPEKGLIKFLNFDIELDEILKELDFKKDINLKTEPFQQELENIFKRNS